MAFLLKLRTASFYKSLTVTLVFEKKRHFSPKIGGSMSVPKKTFPPKKFPQEVTFPHTTFPPKN
jgi:hypothetical protein